MSSPIKHGQSKDGPIYVIGNTTFSCEGVPVEYQGYSFGTLTDNDMMSIFVKNGGSFIPNFMAINREQAMKNFKNFQITGSPIKVTRISPIAPCRCNLNFCPVVQSGKFSMSVICLCSFNRISRQEKETRKLLIVSPAMNHVRKSTMNVGNMSPKWTKPRTHKFMKPYPKMVGENCNLKGKRHNKMGRGFSVQNILRYEKRERHQPATTEINFWVSRPYGRYV